MKLAISNIAWTDADDATIAPALVEAGAEGIEVAPGRVFEKPAAATEADAARVRERWEGAGLPVRSMQALLFGQERLRLFGDEADARAFTDYLGHVIRLAGALGCGPLVFGSPGNRRRGDMPFAEACRRAVPSLRRLGDAAQAAGCVLCLEPNATDYGCDFMTTLGEAAEVVVAVDNPGVGLVVDTGNMQMMGEPAEAALEVAPLARHLHLSMPRLAPIDADAAFVGETVSVMRRAGYPGGATLEMRAPQDRPAREAAVVAVRVGRAWIDA